MGSQGGLAMVGEEDSLLVPVHGFTNEKTFCSVQGVSAKDLMGRVRFLASGVGV